MSLQELVPAVRALPRADKLRLIHMLAVDLAREEDVPLIVAGQSYPVWSPFDAFDAASTLLQSLDKERAAS